MPTDQQNAKCASVTAELHRQWDSFEAPHRPSSLWIACCERGLDRALEDVMSCGPVLMLRWPGSRPPVRSAAQMDCRAGVEFAVRSLRVSEIVICGHSPCAHLRETAPIPVYPPIDQPDGGGTVYDSLVRRVVERQALIVAAQQNVVDQLADLASDPRIGEAVAAGKLQLQGMFYLAESDLFLMLDPPTGEFILLDQALTAEEPSVPSTSPDGRTTLSQTPVTDRFVCSYQPSL